MKCKNIMKHLNKKADLESVVKIILWIVFFGIALVALYFLIRRMIA